MLCEIADTFNDCAGVYTADANKQCSGLKASVVVEYRDTSVGKDIGSLTRSITSESSLVDVYGCILVDCDTGPALTKLPEG